MFIFMAQTRGFVALSFKPFRIVLLMLACLPLMAQDHQNANEDSKAGLFPRKSPWSHKTHHEKPLLPHRTTTAIVFSIRETPSVSGPWDTNY